jgi:hypothetical protein
MAKAIEEKTNKNDLKRLFLAGRKQEAEALRYLISILQKEATRKPAGKLPKIRRKIFLQKELKQKEA